MNFQIIIIIVIYKERRMKQRQGYNWLRNRSHFIFARMFGHFGGLQNALVLL